MKTATAPSQNFNTKPARRHLARNLGSMEMVCRKLRVQEAAKFSWPKRFDALVIAREDLPFRRDEAYAE